MTLRILLLLFGIIGQLATAQINTEALRKNLDEEGLQGQLSFDLSLNSGNSEYLKLKLSPRIDYFFTPFSAFLVGSYQRGIQADKVFINKGFLHARFMRDLFRQHQVEFFIQKEFNDFIKLNDRDLIGSGLRFQIINVNDDQRTVHFFLGSGLMWEHEVLVLSADNLEETQLRSTNYISVNWKENERFHLIAIAYFQQSLERGTDYRVLSDTSLIFKLTDNVVFRVSLNYRLDNEPPVDVKKYDLELSNGLNLMF
jgi:hypothetical protein